MWHNFTQGWRSFVREITFNKDPVIQLPEKTVFPKMPTMKVKKLKQSKKLKSKLTEEPEIVKHTSKEPDILEEYTTRVDPPVNFDIPEQLIETPQDRLDRLDRVSKKKKVRFMSGKRQQLLFLNPGSQRIKECLYALQNNGVLPDWAQKFPEQLSVKNNTLFFENLPVVTHEEKIHLVKSEYFNPSGQSTIHGITSVLRPVYANISRTNIQRILRTFETYQLNFPRRRPPKIMGRMSMKKPGIIACDMFFPNKRKWQRESNCLVMMDCYSRYCQAYNVEKKNKLLVEKGMKDFFAKILSLGVIPSIGLSDKGTDLAPFKVLFEQFRNGRKGDIVFHSKTGTPVNIVEALNAQIERRMEIFATSGLTDNPGLILTQICDSINNQPRPVRGNMTPLQLLRLDKEGRSRINAQYKIQSPPDTSSLRELFIGSQVRVLLMTMKEQLRDKKKGFEAKWSRDVYVVNKKRALRGNPNNFRYFVRGLHEGFFRHELLWISKVDSEIYDLVGSKDSTFYEDFSD